MGSHKPVSLELLKDILALLSKAAANSIRKSTRYTPRPRNSLTAHDRRYPTDTHLLVEQLLGEQYIASIVEDEFSLDDAATKAVERLVENLDSLEDCGLKWSGLGSDHNCYLPDRPLEQRALKDALCQIKDELQRCQETYEKLDVHQKRAAVEAMKLTLWSRFQNMCDELQNVSDSVNHFRCSRCQKLHDTMVCYTVPLKENNYALRMKLEQTASWHLANLSLESNSIPHRRPVVEPFSCEVMHRSLLQVRLVRDGVKSVKLSMKPIASGRCNHTASMISIRSWLLGSSQHAFDLSERARATLAVEVAYFYLYLSGTTLWPDHEDMPDFWFEKTDETRDFDVHRPFLALRCDKSAKKSMEFGWERRMNMARPSLPALGKLLLEIWLGRILTWDEIDTIDVTDPRIRDNHIGRLYHVAVSRCFSSNTLSRAGLLHQNQQMSSEYTSWVVKRLQYIVEIMYGVRQKDIFDTVYAASNTINPGTIPPLKRSQSLRFEESKDQDSAEEVEDVQVISNGIGNVQLMDKVLPKTLGEQCIHEDGTIAELDSAQKLAAESWMNDLKEKAIPFLTDLRKGQKIRKVRVAVLDTGASVGDRLMRHLYQGRLKEYRSWCRNPIPEDGEQIADGEDSDGHGTQAASVLLDVADHCQVYVAKIFEGRKVMIDKGISVDSQQRIAYAIKYAVRTWKVDIISMSFGFEQPSAIIKDAIEEVVSQKPRILIFAAAGNHGALRAAPFPAVHKDVIAISALSGKGNLCDAVAARMDGKSNFATLGSAVKTFSIDGKEVYRSGSSIATPIAAGIAALIVDMMRSAKRDYISNCTEERRQAETVRYDRCMEELTSKSGMTAVFNMIVGTTGKVLGYSFLAPAMLMRARETGFATTDIDRILREISESCSIGV